MVLYAEPALRVPYHSYGVIDRVVVRVNTSRLESWHCPRPYAGVLGHITGFSIIASQAPSSVIPAPAAVPVPASRRCPQCNTAFTRPKSMRICLWKTHVGTVCRFPCCNTATSTEADLRGHHNQDHGRGRGEPPCYGH